jgi:hypothetical protein
VQPEPGLKVALVHGQRVTVERLIDGIVLLKNGDWMELEAFKREARSLISARELNIDDIPF